MEKKEPLRCFLESDTENYLCNYGQYIIHHDVEKRIRTVLCHAKNAHYFCRAMLYVASEIGYDFTAKDVVLGSFDTIPARGDIVQPKPGETIYSISGTTILEGYALYGGSQVVDGEYTYSVYGLSRSGVGLVFHAKPDQVEIVKKGE